VECGVKEIQPCCLFELEVAGCNVVSICAGVIVVVVLISSGPGQPGKTHYGL